MRFVGGGMRFHGHSSSIHHPPRCMPFLQLATTPIQQIYLSIYLADASMHTRSSNQLVSDGTTSGAEQDARARSAHAFLLIGSSLKIYSSEAASIHVRYLNLNYRIGDNYITLVNYMMMHVDSIIC